MRVTLTITFLSMVTELSLKSHNQGFWQLLPLIVLCVCYGFFIFFLLIKNNFASHLFQVGNACLVIVGIIGIYLHLKNNWEFELELHPSDENFNTLLNSLSGAIPILAPGAVILQGVLGQLILLIQNIKFIEQ